MLPFWLFQGSCSVLIFFSSAYRESRRIVIGGRLVCPASVLFWCSSEEGSTIHPICELSSSGALPFYMTLARYTETTVQCEKSGRCLAARGPGCRRACMTLHTPSNTARRRSKFCSNRHRKLLPLRQT
ncbi:unnamed protein product, partial [Brenthis ino]